MSDVEATLRPHPDVLIQKMPNGEAVLLNMETEVYYGLDEVGAQIWESLAETGNIEDTVAELIDQFDVDGDQLSGDVRSLVKELARAGLVVSNKALN